MKITRYYNRGFTLIEIMIALLVSSIVMAAGYAAYRSQTQAYLTQQQVVDMQQNVRAVMYYITTDMRMAGYGLWGSSTFGFDNPKSVTVTLQMDLDDDNDVADPDEQVVYALAGSDLTRNGEVLSPNIDALNFVYLTDDENGDGRGDVLPVDAGTGIVQEPDKIRSVEITVVARAGEKELSLTQQFTDQRTYKNQQGTLILDKSGDNRDKFRRRLYSSVAMCRNLGLAAD